MYAYAHAGQQMVQAQNKSMNKRHSGRGLAPSGGDDKRVVLAREVLAHTTAPVWEVRLPWKLQEVARSHLRWAVAARMQSRRLANAQAAEHERVQVGRK